MKVKASGILRMCHDRELEHAWAERYARLGYPPLEVVWDIPKTSENLKLINDFVYDYSGNPFAKSFLRKKKEDKT